MKTHSPFPLFKRASKGSAKSKTPPGKPPKKSSVPAERQLTPKEKAVTCDQFVKLQQNAEAKYGLPKGMLAMIIHQETRGNPAQVSSAGATSVFQILPSVSKDAYGIEDLTDIAQVTNGVAAKLASMRTGILAYPNSKNYFGLGGDRGWELASLEYIAGRGNVTKWLNAGAPMSMEQIAALKAAGKYKSGVGSQSLARLKYMAEKMKSGFDPEVLRPQWEAATGQRKAV